ncbi:hypothetical protein Ddye_032341 [Dipteronia dyeriana]|uniref:Phytocyanin domain-containing protein n=1 Tax=Dipteronia dyeriana TaxID=168575 RepID=A0AAD9TL09_9ROSI|nr:hypothetical protein Ddye_032341 [Dipteronia dyeriana]
MNVAKTHTICKEGKEVKENESLQFEIGFTADYTDGDEGGWSFGVSNWTKGKSFEVEIFLNSTTTQNNLNVVVIDEKGYKTCTVGGDVKKYYSGHVQITIMGKTIFICRFPGCDDMKLVISV